MLTENVCKRLITGVKRKAKENGFVGLKKVTQISLFENSLEVT